MGVWACVGWVEDEKLGGGVRAWGGAALGFVGSGWDGADVVEVVPVAMVAVGVTVVVAHVELADGFPIAVSVPVSERGLAGPVAVESVHPVPVSISVAIWFWEVSVPIPVPVPVSFTFTFTLSVILDR